MRVDALSRHLSGRGSDLTLLQPLSQATAFDKLRETNKLIVDGAIEAALGQVRKLRQINPGLKFIEEYPVMVI